MNGQKRLHAFVDSAVRKELAKLDARTGSWDFNRLFRIMCATVSALAVLPALFPKNVAPSPAAVTQLVEDARRVSTEIQEESIVQRSFALVSGSVEEQLDLSEELRIRVAELHLADLPFRTLANYVEVLAPFPWQTGPGATPAQQTSGTVPASVNSLMSGNILLALPAQAPDRDRDQCPACCCQPAISRNPPVPPDPGPSRQPTAPDAIQAAEVSAKASATAAKAAADQAQKTLDEFQSAATNALAIMRKPIVVTYRVLLNGFSECQMIPDIGAPPDRQLIVQFEASLTGPSVLVTAHNCNPNDAENSLGPVEFQGTGTMQVDVKPAESSCKLNVKLIALETQSRIAGIGRKKTAIVISAWITRTPK